jgi:RimJ/RimL family protein N-acetyltransferase
MSLPTSLQTARLMLRRPLAADVDAYLAVFGSAAANAANPRGFCADRAAAAQALRQHGEHWDWHGFDVWAVSLRAEPSRVIGFGGIGLRQFDEVERLNLGYGLNAAVWGQGYAKELVAASVEASGALACLGDLWARVHRDNGASRRVLESAGLGLDPSRGGASELWYRLSVRGARA